MLIKIKKPVILSTAYLPNIQYFSKLLLHEKVIIDIHETFLKQSYRNRCEIFGANGKHDIYIPIIKPNGNRTLTKDITIDYSMPWQLNHWRAIVSAYGNSPFFEIFVAELAPVYEKKEKFLIDFNYKVLTQLFYSIGINTNIKFSDCYQKAIDKNFDFRNSIHPKKRMQKPDSNFSPLSYFQVFKEKFGFQPNLSFIDLMFNEGPQAIDICSACIKP